MKKSLDYFFNGLKGSGILSMSLKNKTIDLLDTPSLIVDLDLMENNSLKMMNFLKGKKIVLRPHTKAHKIPELAKFQISQGAKGICTSKLGEAEVMLEGGLDDILITTPIANEQKINRMINILKAYPKARIIQVVDNVKHVNILSDKLKKEKLSLEVLVEVDAGQKRCGVQVGPDLIKLVKSIRSSQGLKFVGYQAYSGHLQHIHGYEKRRELARQAVMPLVDFLAKENDFDLNYEILSGGGTGTYDAYENLPFTELQAGSYLFMDSDYKNIGSKDGHNEYTDFRCALKVISTIISMPTSTRAVVDAGMKCLSVDSGMPTLEHYPEVFYRSGGDEHGILDLPEGFLKFDIGQKLMFIPSHCDTTLNQFNKLYGVRKNIIESEWDIKGRGRSD